MGNGSSLEVVVSCCGVGLRESLTLLLSLVLLATDLLICCNDARDQSSSTLFKSSVVSPWILFQTSCPPCPVSKMFIELMIQKHTVDCIVEVSLREVVLFDAHFLSVLGSALERQSVNRNSSTRHVV